MVKIFNDMMEMVKLVNMIGMVKLYRHYFSSHSQADVRTVGLHRFANASLKAHGAVVYLRAEFK